MVELIKLLETTYTVCVTGGKKAASCVQLDVTHVQTLGTADASEMQTLPVHQMQTDNI